jgi:hypothetical protein
MSNEPALLTPDIKGTAGRRLVKNQAMPRQKCTYKVMVILSIFYGCETLIEGMRIIILVESMLDAILKKISRFRRTDCIRKE